MALHQGLLKQYESKLKALGPQIHKIKNNTDAGYAAVLKMIEDGKITIPNKKKELFTVANPNRFKLIENKIPISLKQQIQTDIPELGRCEKAILKVLVTRNGIRTSKSQAGILSGYSSGSGGFNNSISKLRSYMFIKGSGDDLAVTEAGLEMIGNDFEPLPVGQALHEYWYNKLGKCEKTLLKVLIDAYPQQMTKENLGELSEYSPSSGGFNNALSTLRTLELIEGRGGELKASDSLF